MSAVATLGRLCATKYWSTKRTLSATRSCGTGCSRATDKPKNLSLKDLLAKAGIVETEGAASRQTIETKPPASPEHLEHHLQQQASQRRLLDFAFIGIILILLILVILLAMSRR